MENDSDLQIDYNVETMHAVHHIDRIQRLPTRFLHRIHHAFPGRFHSYLQLEYGRFASGSCCELQHHHMFQLVTLSKRAQHHPQVEK